MTPDAARRVFLALTVTRWFPIGLVVGVMTLWPLERGLSVTETLTATAFTGWVVFALELPTSGVADAFGRRPVYVVASLVGVASALTYVLSTSFWGFALGAVLAGVFRALDSGPLEAWFVDAVHAHDPDAEVAPALSAQSTVLGLSIAVGSLTSSGLVAWHPLDVDSALLLPFLLWTLLSVVHVAAVLVLMSEPRDTGEGSGRAIDSVREAPEIVREGLALLRDHPVLRGLVIVEGFWCVGLITFELFTPVRLAELLGSEDRAGFWMGAAAAAGWLVFAAGSALAGLLSPRLGVVTTAILARVLNGLGAVAMGLVAGPVALVVTYLVTYALHGSASPVHSALLHREATARNRATVLSINSMTSWISFAVLSPVLALLAGATSTQVAMVTAGAVSVVGAVFYLPARRAEASSTASSTGA